MKKILEDEKLVFSKVEKEFYKIYSELIDAEEISLYKSELLKTKIVILAEYLSDYIQDLNDYNKELKTKYKKMINITYIVTLLSILVIFLNPWLPAIVNLICMFIRTKIHKNYQENNKGTYIEDECNGMMILIQNCFTFLEKKERNREEAVAKQCRNNPEKIREIIMSNFILQSYLESDDVGDINEMIFCCDEKIKISLIQILQDDLHTDNNNLEELLATAKEKVSVEILAKELKLSRNLSKKDEK